VSHFVQYCSVATSGAHRHNDVDVRPDGLLIIAIAQLLAAVSLLLPEAILSFMLFIAASLCAVGAVRLVSYRLGSRPEITERETAIVSAGLALMFFVLIVEPNMNGGFELAEAVIASSALGVTMFAMFLVFWLVGYDKDSLTIPLGMTAISQALVVLVVGDFAGSFSPAVIISSEVNVRRSLISFSVVLVGPVLIGVDLLTSLELSLPFVTVGSSALSLVVAIHLLGLVRRWVAVEHRGQHDPLTGLPNRPLFFTRLGMAIESARLRDARFVTMFLDLDRFKAVNDTLGHDAGDELLRQVATRLHDASLRVGANLTVARLGGDEFAILVPAVKDARHSHAIGRLFLDQFLEPFDVGLRDIYMTPSIGIAEFPKDGNSVEELIENADTAMFEAKERGRNMVVSYSPEQRVPGAHRLEIEAGLHRALENKELELYYQPQIDIVTGEIFAVEALLRWKHPTLGMISPEKFVPVAEESTLIDSIGRWILDEACATAAGWSKAGLPAINVAVNLSPRQFQKAVHLTDNVTRALRESGLPPQRLELELTESLALEKPEEVNATLSRFRDMGIRTAIDDFGVGHTGLDYLDRIEVDTLKIDRSFINRIGESGAPLVTAVISLARGLNLDVIAEGVESRAQVNFLREHGCRYMQGYLFSKPLTASQLEQVLRNQMRRKQVEKPVAESVESEARESAQGDETEAA
jgi:diguanylate cyclase (GGDEF)-like protein